jgi:hypothetical protein
MVILGIWKYGNSVKKYDVKYGIYAKVFRKREDIDYLTK